MQTKSGLVTGVKAGPADGLNEGEFLVYPSTFTRTPDAYGDVVAKGAFAQACQYWTSGNSGVLPGYYGHRLDDPFMNIAWALDMGEDDHGWWVKGMFDHVDNPTAAQVYRLVKGRRLVQLSFGFDVLDEARIEIDGRKVNELRRLKVYEFSFVPIGANQDTSVVAVKDAAVAMAQTLAKAGRTLSAKNEDALRMARDHIDAVLSSLGEDDTTAAATVATASTQGKASGTATVKSDEEPARVKSDEEPKLNPSADLRAIMFKIYERTMG